MGHRDRRTAAFGNAGASLIGGAVLDFFGSDHRAYLRMFAVPAFARLAAALLVVRELLVGLPMIFADGAWRTAAIRPWGGSIVRPPVNLGKRASCPVWSMPIAKLVSRPTWDIVVAKLVSRPTRDIVVPKLVARPTWDIVVAKLVSRPTWDIVVAKLVSRPTWDIAIPKLVSRPTWDIAIPKLVSRPTWDFAPRNVANTVTPIRRT